ncbi:MAG: DUF2059 domain-containing protein [Alphaproteobacteria bacterium]|nr:DUF2059 domain-containing protein [Alphaproteobacteria bacterium]
MFRPAAVFPILVALSVAWTAPAFAQNAPAPNGGDKQARLVTLINLLNVAAVADEFIPVFAERTLATLRRGGLAVTPDIEATVRSATHKVLTDNLPVMEAKLAALYGESFEPAEIDQLIQFYASDTGQKTARLMPRMVIQSQVFAFQWAQGLQPQLNAEIKAALTALAEQHRHKTPTPPAGS